MIEMRWYVNSDFIKVLQYRYYSLDTQRSPVASWSDWIDVPTVEE